ncbi:MAG: ATP-binding protein [Candidatus Omnitrophica bacterium]|nr:ATP-binding protein [Candidatus Omnitrophota bacterium]
MSREEFHQAVNSSTLKVTVDKSHIVAIGEKLYGESVELVRELVNNSYDADATQVEVTITDEKIIVSDNGTGMDLEGLKQYFNVGSQEKILKNKSEKFSRDRIGQFGIGKFAALTAARTFEVDTQRGGFHGRVIFDKVAWQASAESWELPLTVLPLDSERGDGTKVILTDLLKKFDLVLVERRLVESVPLMDPNFEVVLNGFTLLPKRYQGQKIPILEGTPFGVIHGELVILPASSASTLDLGIDVKVKKVTIKRELFGMETWGRAMTRVRGEIHADFLPVTSDRSGFVLDSEEYKVFCQVMEKVMSEIKKVLTHLAEQTHGRKASRVLKDALERIKYSLAKHPELSPFGPIPIGEEGGIGGSGLIRPKKGRKPAVCDESSLRAKPEKEKKPKVHSLSPNAVIKKVKFGDTGVSCVIDGFGPEASECFQEGGVIYINRDHSLYRREEKRGQTLILHLTRILAQEISLMASPSTPREAFEKQSELLKSALEERSPHPNPAPT